MSDRKINPSQTTVGTIFTDGEHAEQIQRDGVDVSGTKKVGWNLEQTKSLHQINSIWRYLTIGILPHWFSYVFGLANSLDLQGAKQAKAEDRDFKDGLTLEHFSKKQANTWLPEPENAFPLYPDSAKIWKSSTGYRQAATKTSQGKSKETPDESGSTRSTTGKQSSIDKIGSTNVPSSKSVSKQDVKKAQRSTHNLQVGQNTKSERTPILTVEVTNLHLTYGVGQNAHQVLKGVNMTVEEGHIYGLLGSSGCGKTTLLKCILGQSSYKMGKVLVFGKRPGTPGSLVPGAGVGYMPQDISLYNSFTIGETYTFFSRLFGMTKEARQERTEFLIKFLDLPPKQRLVKDLSGGQRRRVSLGAALIHTPPLLILDEPTVGVDPVLRENIWAHLSELSKAMGMTTIITTHYIDETKLANYIGFMRRGVMLVETTPKDILANFNVVSLEVAFLKLCLMQQADEIKVESRPLTGQQYSTGGNVQGRQVKLKDALLALVGKNYINLTRNYRILIIQTLLPTFVIYLFCICVGITPEGLKVAIVNKEASSSNGTLNIRLFSELVIQNINDKYITKVSFDSEEEACKAVDHGTMSAVYVFQQRFGDAVFWRFNRTIPPMARNLPSEQSLDLINQSTIRLITDVNNEVVYVTVLEALSAAIDRAFNKLPSSEPRSIYPKAYQKFVKQEAAVHGDLNPIFRDFMAPGLALCCIYFLAVGLTVLTFIIEKNTGLFHRTMVAGVKPYQFLLAHVIVQFVIICVQVLLLLLLVFVWFKIPYRGGALGYVWTTLLTIAQGMVGMSLGFLLSATYDDEKDALLSALGTFFPSMILSGVLWPLEGMPAIIKYFCYFLPQTEAVIAMRDLWNKGYGLDSSHMVLAFVVPLSWMIILDALSVLIFTLRK